MRGWHDWLHHGSVAKPTLRVPCNLNTHHRNWNVASMNAITETQTAWFSLAPSLEWQAGFQNQSDGSKELLQATGKKGKWMFQPARTEQRFNLKAREQWICTKRNQSSKNFVHRCTVACYYNGKVGNVICTAEVEAGCPQASGRRELQWVGYGARFPLYSKLSASHPMEGLRYWEPSLTIALISILVLSFQLPMLMSRVQPCSALFSLSPKNETGTAGTASQGLWLALGHPFSTFFPISDWKKDIFINYIFKKNIRYRRMPRQMLSADLHLAEKNRIAPISSSKTSTRPQCSPATPQHSFSKIYTARWTEEQIKIYISRWTGKTSKYRSQDGLGLDTQETPAASRDSNVPSLARHHPISLNINLVPWMNSLHSSCPA